MKFQKGRMMLKKKPPLRWLRLAASVLVGVAVASTWLVSAGAASATSGSVDVSVGYADTLRAPSSHFPTPWRGAPGVTFLGCSPSAPCDFDGGAVRVSNNSTATVHVDDVKVHIDTCPFDLWGASMPVTLAPGHDLILAQTVSEPTAGCTKNGSMDTSDVGPGGAKWSGVCTADGIVPTVDVTVDGVTKTELDTGRVLNTGGVDGATCAHGNQLAGNESQSWTPIGQDPCSGAALTLSPPTQTHTIGSTATVTASFSTSCGPLSNTAVAFVVPSGPKMGTTGTATTDANGRASFSYSSLKSGTDTVQASVSNPAGTIHSSTVAVHWIGTFLADGAFVIADRAAVMNGHVEFWGAQWAKNNHPSRGAAPNAFKGYADTTTTTPPACGHSWTARAGNSLKPPAGPLPTDMVVIVSSKVTQKGSTISGNILHLVVVKVNPGYAPNPGHAGTGKVEGVVC
jgi:hypothetical protein